MSEDGEEKSFKDLGVIDRLADACARHGWRNPTNIQVKAIPLALEGKDIIVLAPTLSGKTATFAIPILQALLEAPKPRAFFACVLSPTRELAIQIAEQFHALGAGTGVRCALLFGVMAKVQQTIALAKNPHIVVASPGRLIDHLSNTEGFSLHLRSLKYLVLAEADILMSEGFGKSIEEILNKIPRERSTFLVSATMTKEVKKFQRTCLRNPVTIEASALITLEQRYCSVPTSNYKDCCLVYVLTKMSGSTSIIFTRTCYATMFLANVLRILNFVTIPICDRMTRASRLESLNNFWSGECNILVCTDAASRGLDIPSVDIVINYELPISCEDYIPRVERTRLSGVAISILTQYELEWFVQIERLIGKKLLKYDARPDEVLLLLERVVEAKSRASGLR